MYSKPMIIESDGISEGVFLASGNGSGTLSYVKTSEVDAEAGGSAKNNVTWHFTVPDDMAGQTKKLTITMNGETKCCWSEANGGKLLSPSGAEYDSNTWVMTAVLPASFDIVFQYRISNAGGGDIASVTVE